MLIQYWKYEGFVYKTNR